MPTSNASHLPALDGLRGLALLLVLGYHLSLVGCGWVGVQLFFVLSGFLITRQLLAWREGHSLGMSLRRFYVRRSLRIWPLYYLYLAAALLLAPLLTPLQTQGLHAQWPWAAGFAFNWLRMTPWQEPSLWLDHLWSLAVEEQFYLVWPWLVLTLRGTHLRRVLLGLVLAGPLLRLLFLLLWAQSPWADRSALPFAVAVSTVSHLDAFAIGGILHFYQAQLAQLRWPLAWLCAALGLAYLPAGLVQGWGLLPVANTSALTLGYANSLAGNGQFLWGYTLLNLVAALLVGLVAAGRLGAGVFQQPALRWVGKVSFGAYVLHFPLAHLMAPLVGWLMDATGWDQSPCLLLFALPYCAVLFALAASAFYGWERYFLKLKTRLAP